MRTYGAGDFSILLTLVNNKQERHRFMTRESMDRFVEKCKNDIIVKIIEEEK